MKIKAKLVLGIGFLFGMITLLTVMSIVYINRLSEDTESILTHNYQTIDYSRRMLMALNEGISDRDTQNEFGQNLRKQSQNITEAGEKELTVQIAADYELLLTQPGDSLLLRKLRKDLGDVILLNMQAIYRKSTLAEKTADTSIYWISITGTICFILAFMMLFNLPSNIADPIKELTASIKQIARKDYSQRVHFRSRSEFGELAGAFNTMAEKLEEYSNSNLAKLMMEKKRIEILINSMNEPVIGLDAQDHILFMNDISLNISGLTKEQAIGRPLNDVAKQNDLVRALAEGFSETTADVADRRKMPLKIFANGKESYFEKEVVAIRMIPTGETEEKKIGNFIILQNITPYKELDSAKTNFIANVSHELKTPISSIRMGMELLANPRTGHLNAGQRELISGIGEDTGRLLKITAELLNMTQLESGSIPMNMAPTDVAEIVEYALNSTQSAAAHENIKIRVGLPAGLPKIYADGEKTAWVLTNLLTNAIRYSYENSTIDLAVGPEGNKLRFEVIDNGQGIPPEYVDKVFDRYFRIPGSAREGTGLGLSIGKEFIEAQGGGIMVKSELGAGSTFSFYLNCVPETL